VDGGRGCNAARVDDTPLTPPYVSQAEAARICRVSTATVRRARVAGRLEGVKADGAGWLIPIPALVAAGLLDRVSPPDTVTPPSLTPDTTPLHVTLAEMSDLRDRLAAAERRAAVAEAIAEERALALADLRTSMRLIAAAPAPASKPPESVEVETRRPWWSRRRPVDPRSVVP